MAELARIEAEKEAERRRPTMQKGLMAAKEHGFHFQAGDKYRGTICDVVTGEVLEEYPHIRAKDKLSFVGDVKVIRENFEISMLEFYHQSLELPMTLRFRQYANV